MVSTQQRRVRADQRGFTLLSMATWCVVLFCFLGLSVDIARLFINKAEVQTFADSAALAAARELDGTTAGIAAARETVARYPQKWNFQTEPLANVTTEFSTAAEPDNWTTNPGFGTDYTRVRVTVAPTQRLFFMPVQYSSMVQVVRARASAEQKRLGLMYEGAFPFAPMGFNNAGPHYGLVPGQQYTLRYPSADRKDACPGDQGAPMHYSRGPERGFWGDSSTEVIGQRIENDYQSGAVIRIGSLLPSEGGAKTTIVTHIDNRVQQDSDLGSETYADYVAFGAGNGRRVVIMPIQDESTSIVLGLGMFFLNRQGAYNHSGNRPWCAEYVGAAGLPNSPTPGAGIAGAYQIRLVE